VPVPPPKGPPSSSVSAARVSSTPKYCSQCGTPAGTGKFCSECGNAL
jgi:membrane protease subunit (stomatin/prohibitin family)